MDVPKRNISLRELFLPSIAMCITIQMYVCIPDLPTDECPFKQAAVTEKIPARLQDSNLATALTGIPEDSAAETTQMCPHNSAFFALPNAQEVLQQQMLEMQQRTALQAAQAQAPDAAPASDTD